MALINCSECGNKVSTNASACPKCGNPINEIEDNNGKIIIHGYKETLINKPTVEVFINSIKVGSLEKDETLEIEIINDCEVVFIAASKKVSLPVKANKTTEIYLSWDRTLGNLVAEKRSNKTVANEIKTGNNESKTKKSKNNNKKKIYSNSSIVKKNSYFDFFVYLFLAIVSFLLFRFSNWLPLLTAIGLLGMFGTVPLCLKSLLDCASDPVVYYICPKCEKHMSIHSSKLGREPYEKFSTKCGYCFSKIIFDFKENSVTAEENDKNI